jgi:hypothetical protein
LRSIRIFQEGVVTDCPVNQTDAQRLAAGWNTWADARIAAAIEPILGEFADEVGEATGQVARELTEARAAIDSEIARLAADHAASRDAEIGKLRQAFDDEAAVLRGQIETLRDEIAVLRSALGSDCAIVPLGKRRA